MEMVTADGIRSLTGNGEVGCLVQVQEEMLRCLHVGVKRGLYKGEKRERERNHLSRLWRVTTGKNPSPREGPLS